MVTSSWGASNIEGKHNPQKFRLVLGIPFETLTGEFSKGQKGNSWDHLEKGRVVGRYLLTKASFSKTLFWSKDLLTKASSSKTLFWSKDCFQGVLHWVHNPPSC